MPLSVKQGAGVSVDVDVGVDLFLFVEVDVEMIVDADADVKVNVDVDLNKDGRMANVVLMKSRVMSKDHNRPPLEQRVPAST